MLDVFIYLSTKCYKSEKNTESAHDEIERHVFVNQIQIPFAPFPGLLISNIANALEDGWWCEEIDRVEWNIENEAFWVYASDLTCDEDGEPHESPESMYEWFHSKGWEHHQHNKYESENENEKRRALKPPVDQI